MNTKILGTINPLIQYWQDTINTLKINIDDYITKTAEVPVKPFAYKGFINRMDNFENAWGLYKKSTFWRTLLRMMLNPEKRPSTSEPAKKVIQPAQTSAVGNQSSSSATSAQTSGQPPAAEKAPPAPPPAAEKAPPAPPPAAEKAPPAPPPAAEKAPPTAPPASETAPPAPPPAAEKAPPAAINNTNQPRRQIIVNASKGNVVKQPPKKPETNTVETNQNPAETQAANNRGIDWTSAIGGATLGTIGTYLLSNWLGSNDEQRGLQQLLPLLMAVQQQQGQRANIPMQPQLPIMLPQQQSQDNLLPVLLMMMQNQNNRQVAQQPVSVPFILREAPPVPVQPQIPIYGYGV